MRKLPRFWLHLDLVDFLGYLLSLSCPTGWVCSLLTSHPLEGCNIHNVVISYIWTDKGYELYNKPVQDFLKEKNVTHFFSRNEKKANVAERGIKTIKARLSRYMTIHFKFKIGDSVRISHVHKPFDREYDERWTGEHFIVKSRLIKDHTYLRVKGH